MSRAKNDLTGRTFGDLTVLEPAGSSPRGAALWLCRCALCGSETVIEGHRLTTTSGPKTNCGCVRQSRNRDLTGEEHGALTVLERAGTARGGRDRTYLCRCRLCGREKIFPAGTIRSDPIGCGCQRERSSEQKRTASAMGVAALVQDGVNVALARKTTPNVDSTTGYRWVRVLKRRGKEFIFAVFYIQGRRYYRGGFATRESAYRWARQKHAEVLSALGIDADES